MAEPWQILVVDDEVEICQQLERLFQGDTLDETNAPAVVTSATRFSDALTVLETTRIDLLILDVRAAAEEVGEALGEAGNITLKKVRSRRFVPVIFYTGLPNLVEATASDFVCIVPKDAGITALLEAARAVIATGMPAVSRALHKHLDAVMRDYLWDAAESWNKYKNTPDRPALAYLLSRRLAKSLSESRIEQLAGALGNTDALPLTDNQVHPMFYYIMPPVSGTYSTGDIFEESAEKETRYCVLLTNACDLVEREKEISDGLGGKRKIKLRKAEHVLLAQCDLLNTFDEYKAWTAKPTDANIRKLITNARNTGQADRYAFLPSGIAFPDMVVDFQKIFSRPIGDLAKMKHLAAMDSPYAESLAARFTRYYSRIGTPDLNAEVVLQRLAALAK